MDHAEQVRVLLRDDGYDTAADLILGCDGEVLILAKPESEIDRATWHQIVYAAAKVTPPYR